MRKLIIRRKKNLLTAVAVKFAVYVDEQPAGLLGNGGEVCIPISDASHTLRFVSNIAANARMVPPPQTIPAGSGDCTAMVDIKSAMGGLKSQWICSLECAAGMSRADSIGLLCGYLMLQMSRKGEHSTEAKMREFRAAGQTLYIRYSIGPDCVTVSPDERRTGRIVGEPFDIRYSDIADVMECGPIAALTPEERSRIAAEIAVMANSPEFSHLNVERNGLEIILSLK